MGSGVRGRGEGIKKRSRKVGGGVEGRGKVNRGGLGRDRVWGDVLVWGFKIEWGAGEKGGRVLRARFECSWKTVGLNSTQRRCIKYKISRSCGKVHAKIPSQKVADRGENVHDFDYHTFFQFLYLKALQND